MMYYIKSTETDPYLNLALEQHVFDSLPKEHSYFMLWQNDNAIIVGKHQNTMAEINPAYVKEKGIRVARRLSGGGAVYHDMGNLNFTFITDAGEGMGLDFSAFCRPVQKALATLGVTVELSGRNDMTIDGKKFSGNAQYVKRGRVMHHGTLMYSSDISVLGEALNVSRDKIESKGVKSVRSRVTNIRPYVTNMCAYNKEDAQISVFWEALRAFMFDEFEMREYALTEEDWRAVRALREEVYSRWEWNYGQSPAYRLKKERRIEGCGKIEVYLDVGKEGVIQDAAFYGDYFCTEDPQALVERLRGCKLSEGALLAALEGVEIGRYFNNLRLEDFVALMTV